MCQINDIVKRCRCTDRIYPILFLLAFYRKLPHYFSPSKIQNHDNDNAVGIKELRKLLEDIPNKIRNKLGITPSVEVEKRDDKDIIKITVEQQSVPISYDGRYYIRSGSNNFELKESELTDFLLKTWEKLG